MLSSACHERVTKKESELPTGIEPMTSGDRKRGFFFPAPGFRLPIFVPPVKLCFLSCLTRSFILLKVLKEDLWKTLYTNTRNLFWRLIIIVIITILAVVVLRCPSARGIRKKIHRGRLLHEVVNYGLLERCPQ